MIKTLNRMGWFCVHTEECPWGAFATPDGVTRKVLGIWQIWCKGADFAKQQANNSQTCDDYVEMFLINHTTGENVDRIGDADVIFQNNFNGEPPITNLRSYRRPDGKVPLPSKSPNYIGIRILKDHERVRSIIDSFTIFDISDLNTVGFRTIGKARMSRALIKSGICDAVKQESIL